MILADDARAEVAFEFEPRAARPAGKTPAKKVAAKAAAKKAA